MIFLKRKVLISFGILSSVSGIIGYITFWIYFLNIFHTQPIVSLNNLEATQYEDRIDISYIKNIKYGKVISKPKKIDTTTPGEKRITIVIENNYGKKTKYQYFVNVEKRE